MGGETVGGQHFLLPRGQRDLARVAEHQHGAVAFGQLRAARLKPGAIYHRVRLEQLHRVHRAVYALGHARLTAVGRCWAALLATGGVLSHRTAAAVWDLIAWPARLEVTTLGYGESTAAIRVHKTRTLTLDDTTFDPEHGLFVTTPMRTLRDCARVGPEEVPRDPLHLAPAQRRARPRRRHRPRPARDAYRGSRGAMIR